jgi:predicted nucleotidyltransferase component of viral defense system
MKDTYKKQVALLIGILLELAKENDFALHGGTAINLFHLNMPRLSVDIDLTFVPFSENRDDDLNKIRQSLEAIKSRLKVAYKNIRFEDERAEEELKLLWKYGYLKRENTPCNLGNFENLIEIIV